MASDKARFQESTTGDIGQFGMSPEGRVNVEAVHRKFDAKVIEVELSPGTEHGCVGGWNWWVQLGCFQAGFRTHLYNQGNTQCW